MTYLTYRFNARTTTAVTVSPRSAARALAARQSSGGMRMVTCGVFGASGMSGDRPVCDLGSDVLEDEGGQVEPLVLGADEQFHLRGFVAVDGGGEHPGEVVGADGCFGCGGDVGGGHGVPSRLVYVQPTRPVYVRQGVRR